MNAGKTTTLLQSSHNYAERGMSTLLLKPQIDDREGATRIISRIGLEGDAYCFTATEDLYRFVKQHHESETLHCLLVDEGQFLTAAQVDQLGEVVDRIQIPVLVYGIRTDFRGELFEGTMVVRLGDDGRPMRTGAQIQVGGNETYISMCRKHWKAALSEALAE